MQRIDQFDTEAIRFNIKNGTFMSTIMNPYLLKFTNIGSLGRAESLLAHSKY